MSKQYIEFGMLVVALIAVWLLFVFVQNPFVLIVNSAVAFVILLMLNTIFKAGIPINVLTVLIVAIGGILGLLLLILFRILNVASSNGHGGGS